MKSKTNYRAPERIIAKWIKVSASDRRLNNLNCLVIGSSGSGKTSNYTSVNITNSNGESFIVTDSKLNLYNKHKKELIRKGYDVQLIDLCNISNSSIGYNPLDFIRTKGKSGRAVTDDITELAYLLASEEIHSKNEVFWENAARQYIKCCLALCFHILPDDEHDLTYIGRLLDSLGIPDEWNALIKEAYDDDPDCCEVRINKQIEASRNADKMTSSIIGIAQSAMNQFLFENVSEIYRNPKRIRFSDLGERKSCVFINVPDHDQSKTAIVRLFFSQCIKSLLDHADSMKDSRLKVPVHLYCDDIGANFVIPHLPELLSITRSRGISISLMLQSYSQLLSKYGEYDAETIVSNCAVTIFMGGQDLKSPRFISELANKPLEQILGMPRDTEIVCIQGQSSVFAQKVFPEFFSNIEDNCSDSRSGYDSDYQGSF